MSLRSSVLAAALVPLLAAPAMAQMMASPLSFTVFGGAAIPVGEGAGNINTGYTVGAAADLHVPASVIGVRLEGLYANYGAKGLSGTGVSANATDLGANLNLVLRVPINVSSPITPYLTAGPSFSRIKGSVNQGNSSFSVTENHWGFNAGGGVDIGIGALALRLDARYKRISTNEDAYQSVPVTVGIRF